MSINNGLLNIRIRAWMIHALSLARLFFAPRKLLWVLQIKLKAPFLPFDVLPSYEHKFLFDIIGIPSAFVDIGFNKGQFTSLVLLKRPSSRVLAFDPSLESKCIYAPPISQAFPERFHFFNVALGDRNFLGNLNKAISFDNNTLLQPTDENIGQFPRAAMTHQSESVSVTRLDSIDFQDFGDTLFLKIDVQGYEIFVLRGIGDALIKKIRWIYIELAGVNLYYGQASSLDIKAYIYSMGFTLISDYNVYKDPTSGRTVYCDSLFERI